MAVNSDASSLTDDGMANGQTGPHPGQPGAQLAASLGLLACFNLCQRASAMLCVYFQLPPTDKVSMPGCNRIPTSPSGQPVQRAGSKQRSSAAPSPRVPEDRNVSYIGRAPRTWSGALPVVKSQPQVAAVRKRVVIQKRMRFSIVSCSYTAQCLSS